MPYVPPDEESPAERAAAARRLDTKRAVERLRQAEDRAGLGFRPGTATAAGEGISGGFPPAWAAADVALSEGVPVAVPKDGSDSPIERDRKDRKDSKDIDAFDAEAAELAAIRQDFAGERERAEEAAQKLEAFVPEFARWCSNPQRFMPHESAGSLRPFLDLDALFASANLKKGSFDTLLATLHRVATLFPQEFGIFYQQRGALAGMIRAEAQSRALARLTTLQGADEPDATPSRTRLHTYLDDVRREGQAYSDAFATTRLPERASNAALLTGAYALTMTEPVLLQLMKEPMKVKTAAGSPDSKGAKQGDGSPASPFSVAVPGRAGFALSQTALTVSADRLVWLTGAMKVIDQNRNAMLGAAELTMPQSGVRICEHWMAYVRLARALLGDPSTLPAGPEQFGPMRDLVLALEGRLPRTVFQAVTEQVRIFHDAAGDPGWRTMLLDPAQTRHWSGDSRGTALYRCAACDAFGHVALRDQFVEDALAQFMPKLGAAWTKEQGEVFMHLAPLCHTMNSLATRLENGLMSLYADPVMARHVWLTYRMWDKVLSAPGLSPDQRRHQLEDAIRRDPGTIFPESPILGLCLARPPEDVLHDAQLYRDWESLRLKLYAASVRLYEALDQDTLGALRTLLTNSIATLAEHRDGSSPPVKSAGLSGRVSASPKAEAAPPRGDGKDGAHFMSLDDSDDLDAGSPVASLQASSALRGAAGALPGQDDFRYATAVVDLCEALFLTWLDAGQMREIIEPVMTAVGLPQTGSLAVSAAFSSAEADFLRNYLSELMARYTPIPESLETPSSSAQQSSAEQSTAQRSDPVQSGWGWLKRLFTG